VGDPGRHRAEATIDERGRLVADRSVRETAANLGLNKTTVARHLARLRDRGFVLDEEARDHTSRRWDTSRYVLDPSACVEQFTDTPPAEPPPSPSSPELDDRADETVSAFAGHGDANPLRRHRCATQDKKNNTQQQPATTRRPSRRR
jgi:DNA-binding transcriptional MocR family regulator